jgi:hypothetical protein
MTEYEKGMWQVLQCLAVSRCESSLHVAEDIYDFYGMSFHVFYEIGKTQPMSIEIKLE